MVLILCYGQFRECTEHKIRPLICPCHCDVCLLCKAKASMCEMRLRIIVNAEALRYENTDS